MIMLKRFKDMPRKKDIDKTTQPRTVDISREYAGGTYKSRLKSAEKYEKTQDRLVVRVPKGCKNKIEDYVNIKASEDPGNPKYTSDKGRPSVNALIKNLLEAEMGESFS